MVTKKDKLDKLRSNLINEYIKLESFDEFKMIAVTKYGCHISWYNQFSLMYHIYSGMWYDLNNITYYILLPLLILSSLFNLFYLIGLCLAPFPMPLVLTIIFIVAVLISILSVICLCVCNNLNDLSNVIKAKEFSII